MRKMHGYLVVAGSIPARPTIYSTFLHCSLLCEQYVM